MQGVGGRKGGGGRGEGGGCMHLQGLKLAELVVTSSRDKYSARRT